MDSQREKDGIIETIESTESEAIGNNSIFLENFESADAVNAGREESYNEEVLVSVVEETFEENIPVADKQLESLINSEEDIVTKSKDTCSSRGVISGCLHLECIDSQNRESCEHGYEWRLCRTNETVSRNEVREDNLEGVAGVSPENMNFLTFELVSCHYQAL